MSNEKEVINQISQDDLKLGGELNIDELISAQIKKAVLENGRFQKFDELIEFCNSFPRSVEHPDEETIIYCFFDGSTVMLNTKLQQILILNQ